MVQTTFNFQEFCELVNKTVVLMNKKNDADKEENLRLKSYLKTLRIMSRRFKDKEMRDESQKILENLLSESSKDGQVNLEHNELIKRVTEDKDTLKDKSDDKRGGGEYEGLINSNLLKDSIRLREVSEKFNESLLRDKTILKQAKESIQKSSVKSRKVTDKSIVNTEFKASSYLFFSLIIFLVAYLIIRFS